MLTDKEIEDLIRCQKKIIDADPKRGMGPDSKSEYIERRNLEIVSVFEDHQFSIFLRKNTTLTEQFTIGLQYKTKNKEMGKIVLLRYNGSHGTEDFSKDGHYGSFHTHRLTHTLLEAGITEPKETELTEAYNTFDKAVVLFLNKVNISNIKDFFPSPDKQIEMF